MIEISRQELIDINVSILKDIHNFCVSNNIQYSLGYGTLLGAVRHKGFIPWDDDVDIIMPRPAYNKFLEQYKSQKFSLQSFHKKEYGLPFVRVSDETTYKKEYTNVLKNTGIAVDVYPIDGKVPEKEDKFFYKHIGILKSLIRIKSTVSYKRERGVIKNMLMLLLKFIVLPLNLNSLCRKLDTYVQKYDYVLSLNVGSFLSPYGMRDFFPKSCFDEYVLMPFEGVNFYCLKCFHQYLSSIYGDYMIPPSDKERRSDHGAKFYRH